MWFRVTGHPKSIKSEWFTNQMLLSYLVSKYLPLGHLRSVPAELNNEFPMELNNSFPCSLSQCFWVLLPVQVCCWLVNKMLVKGLVWRAGELGVDFFFFFFLVAILILIIFLYIFYIYIYIIFYIYFLRQVQSSLYAWSCENNNFKKAFSCSNN